MQVIALSIDIEKKYGNAAPHTRFPLRHMPVQLLIGEIMAILPGADFTCISWGDFTM